MVKIRELSDSQLVTQIEKYEKIYFQLVNERDKRVEIKGENPILFTKRELALKKSLGSKVNKAPIKTQSNESTQAYQLKLDESEIEEIHQAEKAIEVQEESTEDEVRVTQLLRLSKEQIAGLKGNKQTKKVLKKKVKKKVRR